MWVRLAARATDQVRRDEWNAHERSHTPFRATRADRDTRGGGSALRRIKSVVLALLVAT